jgi:hypothetical protein
MGGLGGAGRVLQGGGRGCTRLVVWAGMFWGGDGADRTDVFHCCASVTIAWCRICTTWTSRI